MRGKLKHYISIFIMLLIAVIVGVLLLTGTLDVDKIIAAVDDNKPIALIVIIALFLLKGCSLAFPYAAVCLGTSLVFDIKTAIPINIIGTAMCISVSYLIGRFSKELTFDKMTDKYPKLKRYFDNAGEYSFTFCFAIHTLHLSMEAQGVMFGLLRTPYLAYLSGSMLALLPSLVYFTVLGDSFDLTNPLFWVFLGIDIMTLVIGLIYAKRNIIDGKGKKDSSYGPNQ